MIFVRIFSTTIFKVEFHEVKPFYSIYFIPLNTNTEVVNNLTAKAKFDLHTVEP